MPQHPMDQDETIPAYSSATTIWNLSVWTIASVIPLIFGINLVRQGFALGGLFILAVAATGISIARSTGNFLRIHVQGDRGLSVRTAFRSRRFAWTDIEEIKVWERSSRDPYRGYRVGIALVFSEDYLALHRFSFGSPKIWVDRTPAELETLVLRLIQLHSQWGGKKSAHPIVI